MKQECYYQVNLTNQEERIYRVVDVNVQRLVTEFDMFGNKLDVAFIDYSEPSEVEHPFDFIEAWLADRDLELDTFGDIEPELVPYFFK